MTHRPEVRTFNPQGDGTRKKTLSARAYEATTYGKRKFPDSPDKATKAKNRRDQVLEQRYIYQLKRVLRKALSENPQLT